MIRKHALFGVALVVSSALVVACSSDDSSNGSNSGGGGTTAGTGASTGSGGETASGGTGTGGTGTGGAVGDGGTGTGGTPLPVKPARAAGFDCSAPTGAAPALKLTQVVQDLNRPVFLTQPAGDTTRLFVLEQDGLISIIQNGAKVATPFLDISSLIERDEGYDERGILGLAFHPNFATNKLFYVYHTTGPESAMKDVIAEYKVSDADPNVADPNSRREVLVIDDPAKNHNGGTIEFAADGFLYLAIGDGGGSNNQYNTAQVPDKLLGKVLRIDVDKRDAGQYGIPPGNLKEEKAEFAPEIWDYGLRNPYRWSIDGCTGDIYIGEVGQGTTEEVDIEPPNTGHRNYGWSITEGNDCFGGGTDCDKTGITMPVATRPTAVAAAIQGGYVYRGAKIPALRGTYIYGEYLTGDIYSLVWDGTAVSNAKKETIDLQGTSTNILSFGQDSTGEIYVLASNGDNENTGILYRIDPQ